MGEIKKDEMKRDVRAELEKGVTSLKSLRDELRVRLHLGSMDVKKQWDELEPKIHAAIEGAARDVSDVSRRAVSESLEALKKLKERL
ncbi:MAG: hypothetical protein ABSC94_00855 [Polyangiaceae bacterium]|jgi:hypothetical protein